MLLSLFGVSLSLVSSWRYIMKIVIFNSNYFILPTISHLIWNVYIHNTRKSRELINTDIFVWQDLPIFGAKEDDKHLNKSATDVNHQLKHLFTAFCSICHVSNILWLGDINPELIMLHIKELTLTSGMCIYIKASNSTLNSPCCGI